MSYTTLLGLSPSRTDFQFRLDSPTLFKSKVVSWMGRTGQVRPSRPLLKVFIDLAVYRKESFFKLMLITNFSSCCFHFYIESTYATTICYQVNRLSFWCLSILETVYLCCHFISHITEDPFFAVKNSSLF